MNRSQLIQVLSEKTEKDKNEIKSIIDELQELIIEEIKAGNRICLTGFGSFKPRLQTSRPARNPRNGNTVLLTPRTIIHFKCAPYLLERMNDNK